MAFPVSASEEGGRKLREAAVRNLNEARKRNAREVNHSPSVSYISYQL